MRLLILISSLILFFQSNSYAKWKYNPGDIIKGEAIFSKKDSFKLPPGEFFVGLNTREQEFKDLLVYQIDPESGYTRWVIHFYATGNTQWQWWNPPKFCKRTNVYFIKKFIGNKTYSCWMVNHYRSDITANRGFWAKVRKYEIENGIKTPDIFVGSEYAYSKGNKVWGAKYFYNPELDGVPKPKNLEWETNEFHVQRIQEYPKHEEFIKKYISISAEFINEFNFTHKIKGTNKLSLQAQDYITNASINVEIEKESNTNETSTIAEELNALKKLLDDGILTQAEFEKGKKKILD